jgi:hypothetical protein
MNIFFGKEHADKLEGNYTVLELDTFKFVPSNATVTAYCAIEMIPIMEMHLIESFRDLHHNLILNYKKQDWNYCQQALEHLMGKWNGELDSFYTELSNRIIEMQNNPPEPGWDGTVIRNFAGSV